MSVGSTTFKLQGTDTSLISAAQIKAGTPAAKEAALKIKGDIEHRLYNLERTITRFCPSTTDPAVKAYAPVAIKALNQALNALNKEHNLSSSWALPTAAATTIVGLGAAHYYELLTPALAKVASYMPAVSMPSLSTVGYNTPAFLLDGSWNVTKAAASFVASPISSFATNVAATASAVDNIWGVSALIPSASTAAIGFGAVLTVLAIAALAKHCLNKPKQA